LKIDRMQLYLQFERPMSAEELANYKGLIKRRISGEPVSYIRGRKEFWSLPFKVGPGVLVPRPDTEVLVERVKAQSSKLKGEEGLRILDIGTGSGNIAIALAKEFSKAQIIAIEVSEDALKYAIENAQLNEVLSQIEFIKADFYSYELSAMSFDLIISNPPYIPTQTIETLGAGVKDFEPKLSLDGGADGLDFYRQIGKTVPSLLKSEGLLVVEIGEEQASAVSELFEKAGFNSIEVFKDYAGLPRVVTARK